MEIKSIFIENYYPIGGIEIRKYVLINVLIAVMLFSTCTQASAADIASKSISSWKVAGEIYRFSGYQDFEVLYKYRKLAELTEYEVNKLHGRNIDLHCKDISHLDLKDRADSG